MLYKVVLTVLETVGLIVCCDAVLKVLFPAFPGGSWLLDLLFGGCPCPILDFERNERGSNPRPCSKCSMFFLQDCLSWLHHNLLSHLPERPDSLRQVPLDLMTRLVSSPRLFVMQTEFSVYVLLRLWMFLRINRDFQGNPQVRGPKATFISAANFAFL